MIKCLLCTIVIELLMAVIIKVKNNKDLVNIILVNIVTNPLVVSIPVVVLVKYNYKSSIIMLLILLLI